MVFMPHWPKSIRNIDYNDNLERVTKALSLLGNPHLEINNIIHIAGTNGKGSTASFIKQILTENGYKVNLYTSPHLLMFNERIFLSNDFIDDNTLYQAIETVRIATENIVPLSFFEATTIAAIIAFKNNPADFTIIETGLGGRLDATNIFPDKLATVFTSISLDHEEFLGNNIKAISCEKAEIISPNSKTIIAKQNYQEAEAIVKYYALQRNNQIINYEVNYDYDLGEENFFFVNINKEEIKKFSKPSLIGEHQIANLATALATIYNLNIKISDERTKKAIQNTYWPCRLEKINISSNYIPNQNDSDIWIDGAHNENAALHIANWFANLKTNNKKILIYGRTAGNDHHKFLKHFREITDQLILVEVQSEPNPTKKHELEKLKTEIDYIDNILVSDDIEDALQDCLIKEKSSILILGSLYLYRDVKLKFFR